MIFGRRYLSSNWKAPTHRILRLIEYLRSCRLVGICMRTSVLLQCIALQRIQIRNYSCERANLLIDLSFSWSLHHHHLYRVWRKERLTLGMSPADPWKSKWLGKCRKSEISLIWCIFTTNNVKSCKIFNETAQTASFTSLISCGNGP